MAEIIPAILVKTEEEFRKRFRQVESLVSWVQIDVVDGKFAPNITWGDPAVVAGIETPVKFEIDLMVVDIERAVAGWLEAVPQVERIIFHQEALHAEAPKREVFDIITIIREVGIEAGMSLKPDTSPEVLFPYIEDGELDAVLFLGVNPGFQGQEFHRDVIKKVALLREKYPNLPIEVDGGVTPAVARELVAVGTTRLIAGSFIFKHPAGPEAALEELRTAANL